MNLVDSEERFNDSGNSTVVLRYGIERNRKNRVKLVKISVCFQI